MKNTVNKKQETELDGTQNNTLHFIPSTTVHAIVQFRLQTKTQAFSPQPPDEHVKLLSHFSRCQPLCQLRSQSLWTETNETTSPCRAQRMTSIRGTVHLALRKREGMNGGEIEGELNCIFLSVVFK